jgi:hypothetical protein
MQLLAEKMLKTAMYNRLRLERRLNPHLLRRRRKTHILQEIDVT